MSDHNEEVVIPPNKLELAYRQLVNWVMFESKFCKQSGRHSSILITGQNNPEVKTTFEKTHWLNEQGRPWGTKMGYTPSIVLRYSKDCITLVQQVQFEMADGELKSILNRTGRIGPQTHPTQVGYIVEDPNFRPFGSRYVATLDELDLAHYFIDNHLDAPVPTPGALKWFQNALAEHRQKRQR